MEVNGKKRILKIFARLQKGEGINKEEIIKCLKIFIKRFFTQQFKRNCLPDGVKVGSISLSPRGDLRLPSDLNYQSYLDEIEKIESSEKYE